MMLPSLSVKTLLPAILLPSFSDQMLLAEILLPSLSDQTTSSKPDLMDERVKLLIGRRNLKYLDVQIVVHEAIQKEIALKVSSNHSNWNKIQSTLRLIPHSEDQSINHIFRGVHHTLLVYRGDNFFFILVELLCCHCFLCDSQGVPSRTGSPRVLGIYSLALTLVFNYWHS